MAKDVGQTIPIANPGADLLMIGDHRHSGGSVRQSRAGSRASLAFSNLRFSICGLGRGESGVKLRFRDVCALRR